MFHKLAILFLIVTAVLIVIHYLLRGRKSAAPGPRVGLLATIIYLFFLISLLGLALTSFIPAVAAHRLAGSLLMLHCVFGPPFAIFFALFILFFAAAPGPGFQKILFWSSAILGVIAIASTLLSMTPLFGQAGQVILFETHRYTSVLLFCFIVLYAYLRRLPLRYASIPPVVANM